jgi:hypothetical protein
LTRIHQEINALGIKAQHGFGDGLEDPEILLGMIGSKINNGKTHEEAVSKLESGEITIEEYCDRMIKLVQEFARLVSITKLHSSIDRFQAKRLAERVEAASGLKVDPWLAEKYENMQKEFNQFREIQN